MPSVGRGIALDHHQSLAGLDEVEGHLALPAQLRPEPLDGGQRVLGIDREELDPGRVLPLPRRAVGHVGGDLPVVQGGVGAVHGAADEFLNQPGIGLRRVAVVAGEVPGERPGVGEQADPASREGGAGEVLREPPDCPIELLARVRQHRPGRADLEPVAELLEGALVVDLGQRAEGRRIEPGHGRDPLVLGGQVEDLLEHRHHDVDLVHTGDALDVGGELLRLGRRGGRGEVARQIPRVAAGRGGVAVAGEHLVTGLAQLADRVEREGHTRAGDQHPHARNPMTRRGIATSTQANAPGAGPRRPTGLGRAAIIVRPRAVSSAGRASRLHREGRRFEPGTAHFLQSQPPGRGLDCGFRGAGIRAGAVRRRKEES